MLQRQEGGVTESKPAGSNDKRKKVAFKSQEEMPSFKVRIRLAWPPKSMMLYSLKLTVVQITVYRLSAKLQRAPCTHRAVRAGDILFCFWARHFTLTVGTAEFNAGGSPTMD